MKTGKLYGVGIGPGDPQYLTLRAADVLRSVDVVFTVISPNASNSVSQSVVDYLQPRGEVRLQVFSMSRDKTIREEQVRANAEAIIAELRAGHDCAFATLGDAMTYSTFGYVLEIIRKAIPNLDLEVIPGITSFATLTAKAGTVLVENGEQLRIIPSFRAEMAEALDFPKGSTTILLKSYRSRGALLDRLAREEKVQVLYGEHRAMKEQALLTDPDAIRARPEKYLSLIVILDEATANVDPESEQELTNAIEALTKEKTIIMIAHRLKTVRHADNILVIDGGKIVQSGTHEQLMQQGGIYRRFVESRELAVGWKV